MNCFSSTSYFDKSSYEPGESGAFSVTINGVDQTLWFTRLEIFFDWGNYWNSVVTVIEPGETKTIKVTFPVPTSVSSGSHSYYYKLTWSLSGDLQNPVTSTSSSRIIAIAEPTPDEPTPEYTVLNATYHALLADYNNLLDDFNSLSVDYYDLLASHGNLVTYFNSLNSTHQDLLDIYTQLQSDFSDLESKHDTLTGDLGTSRNLSYIFIITTIVFVATTAYLAIGKPKVKLE